MRSKFPPTCATARSTWRLVSRNCAPTTGSSGRCDATTCWSSTRRSRRPQPPPSTPIQARTFTPFAPQQGSGRTHPPIPGGGGRWGYRGPHPEPCREPQAPLEEPATPVSRRRPRAWPHANRAPRLRSRPASAPLRTADPPRLPGRSRLPAQEVYGSRAVPQLRGAFPVPRWPRRNRWDVRESLPRMHLAPCLVAYRRPLCVLIGGLRCSSSALPTLTEMELFERLTGRGLPFRNERAVECEPFGLEHEYPNPLAGLDGAGQNAVSLRSIRPYQRQRNLGAVHLDGIEFQTQREVIRRLVLTLEANNPPVRNGARRNQQLPARPDRIQQLPVDGVAGKRVPGVDDRSQCDLDSYSGRYGHRLLRHGGIAAGRIEIGPKNRFRLKRAASGVLDVVFKPFGLRVPNLQNRQPRKQQIGVANSYASVIDGTLDPALPRPGRRLRNFDRHPAEFGVLRIDPKRTLVSHGRQIFPSRTNFRLIAAGRERHAIVGRHEGSPLVLAEAEISVLISLGEEHAAQKWTKIAGARHSTAYDPVHVSGLESAGAYPGEDLRACRNGYVQFEAVCPE